MTFIDDEASERIATIALNRPEAANPAGRFDHLLPNPGARGN